MNQATDFLVATRAALAQASQLAVAYSFSIIGALLLLFIGWTIAGLMRRWSHEGLLKVHGIDETLAQFFSNVIRYVVLILVVVMVLGQFGVQTASMIAALGAAGLAIGLALQGTLQNIAAGIMLLVLRPFRVGEYIETGSVTGTVRDIGLFATELKTADGLYRLAPNSVLWNTPVTNYSREPQRRHVISVKIGYDDDIEATEATLREIATAEPRVQQTPGPKTYVAEFGDGKVTVTLRYWITTGEWWATSRAMTKAAKLAFDKKADVMPETQSGGPQDDAA